MGITIWDTNRLLLYRDTGISVGTAGERALKTPPAAGFVTDQVMVQAWAWR